MWHVPDGPIKSPQVFCIYACGWPTLYQESMEEGSMVMSLEDWKTEKPAACPHFGFWSIILQLELCVLIYVGPILEGNFQLYIEALTKVHPWFLAFDHTHYSRWKPVHLCDLVALEESHTAVYAEFLYWKFAMKKSRHAYSVIAIDQAH